MTFTMADLWAFVHASPFGGWLIPVYSHCTGTGAAQNILDTYLWEDTGGFTLGPQLGAGDAIYRPAAAAVADRERIIGGNSQVFVDTATGKVYTGGAAYTNNPANGELYMITVLRPRIMFDILANVTLRKVPVPIDIPAERFTNAALGSVTGWTAVGGGTFVAETGATNVQTGAASGFWSPANSTDYLESPTFRVRGSASDFGTVNYRVDAGGPVYLAYWDKTNDVEIENSRRVYHSLEQFTVMMRNLQIPPTCEEASVRLYCTNATDRVYVDYANGPWGPNDKMIVLPSWVTRADQVKKVQTASYSSVTALNGAYDAYSRTFDPPLFGPRGKQKGRDYNIRINPAAANPARLELTPNVRISGKELWVEAERPMYDLVTPAFTAAAETGTVFPGIPTLLGLSWIRDMAEYCLTNVDASDVQANAAMTGLVGTKQNPGELAQLLASYEDDLEVKPQYNQTSGWGRPRF